MRRVTLEQITERFWSQVEKTDTCWIGPLTFSFNGRSSGGYRFSYELAHGAVPDGLIVRHRCAVRRCVNPDHLTIGTYQENSLDEVVRRRLGKRPGELYIYEDAKDIELPPDPGVVRTKHPSVMLTITGRVDFSRSLARALLDREAFAVAAGVSSRTINGLCGSQDRKVMRPVTAWKIAHAFGDATGMTDQDAFTLLFEEVAA